MTGRKTKSDSISGQKAAFSQAKTSVPLPDGIVFDHEEEYLIWRQFTAARAADQWRDFDLIMVAKMVQLEYDLRQWKKLLRETGPLVVNKRGTSICNPIMEAIDKWQRQQLAIIRSLSLGVRSDDARALNKPGRKPVTIEADSIEAIQQGKLMSLLNV